MASTASTASAPTLYRREIVHCSCGHRLTEPEVRALPHRDQVLPGGGKVLWIDCPHCKSGHPVLERDGRLLTQAEAAVVLAAQDARSELRACNDSLTSVSARMAALRDRTRGLAAATYTEAEVRGLLVSLTELMGMVSREPRLDPLRVAPMLDEIKTAIDQVIALLQARTGGAK